MDTQTAPVLAAEAVEVTFGDRVVLRGIDLAIEPGARLALVGGPGSGRSTLLRTLNRTEPVSAGVVRFRGQPLPSTGTALATLRADVALILPSFNLPTGLTLADTITAAARRVRGWTHDEAATATADALAQVGLDDHAGTAAGKLSAGQARRAAIARGIALGASVLLLEAPTEALTAPEAEALREVLRDLPRERTVVFTTEDRVLLQQVAGRVVQLEDGRIVGDGRVSTVLAQAPRI